MGAQQSTAAQGGCPCFAFSSPLQKGSDGGNDLLGSPIPDTPRNGAGGRRSSKYIGLEKEVVSGKKKKASSSTSTSKTPKDTLDMAESQYLAQIHEGPVRHSEKMSLQCRVIHV
jgi:hypothetical protein